MATMGTESIGDIVQIGDDLFEEAFRGQASTGADIRILTDPLHSLCIIDLENGANRQALLVRHGNVGDDDRYQFVVLRSDPSYGIPDLYDFLPTLCVCMRGDGALDRFVKPVSEYFRINLQ